MTNQKGNGTDALAAARRLVTPTLHERPEIAMVEVDEADWALLAKAYKTLTGRAPADAVERRIVELCKIHFKLPRLGYSAQESPPTAEEARWLAEAAAALAALEVRERAAGDRLFITHERTRASRGREAARAALEAAQQEYDVAMAAATAGRARLHDLQ